MSSAGCIAFLFLAALPCPCYLFNFLDFLNTGQAGLPQIQPFGPESILDYTRQGLHLLGFFKQLNQAKHLSDALGPSNGDESEEWADLFASPRRGFMKQRRFRDMPLYSKVPNVIKASEDLPGFGGCLPKGTPLFSPMSPSFLQNLLRVVPGAQRIVKKLQPLPQVNPKRLMGKWYWVVSTTYAMSKHCSISSFHGLISKTNKTGSFAILNSFRDGSTYGIPKLGFGYGLIRNGQISIYEQSDPCPYDVILVSEKYEYDDNDNDSQYDYIVLSNWARYPVMVLAKDVDRFLEYHYEDLKEDLKGLGLDGVLSQLLQGTQTEDWSSCDAKHTLGNLAAELIEKLIQRKKL